MPAPRLPRLLASAWIVLASALAPALVARAEQPTIYKWVDANGVAHYTTDRNRIPSALRDRIEQRTPTIPAAAPPPTAGLPPAAPPPNAALPPAPAALPAEAVRPADAAPAPTPAAAASAPVPAPAAASDLARDAAPVASPPPGTRGVAVAAPPPFYAEPAPEKPQVAPDAPRQPAPNVAPTIESEGIAPEPTDTRTRTATAEIGPRKPVDAAVLAELDHQIAELEAQVAKDEDSLTTLISVPEQQRKGPLVDDPRFREIAKRLPKLQADLQALRERRGTLQLSPAPSR